MKVFIIIGLLIAGSVATNAQQCPVMPAGTFCLTQDQANQAAAITRERNALRDENAVLKDSLKEKDKNVEDVKAAAKQNEADLKDRLHKTEVELATKTGQLIASEANQTRQIAIIDLLVKKVGKRCAPLSILCF